MKRPLPHNRPKTGREEMADLLSDWGSIFVDLVGYLCLMGIVTGAAIVYHMAH